MRIIAGRFRRRTLLSNPGDITRPILDRVKESLFQRLEPDLVGKRVADVFAGTGTIGLEALSRGAESCVFIEQDKVASTLLRKNIETLGVTDETICWWTDALLCSYKPKGDSAKYVPFDVIFFDPPYKMAPDIRPDTPIYRAVKRLARPDVSTPDSLFIVRIPERTEITPPPVWEFQWELEMANMIIKIYRKAAAAEAELPAEDAPPPAEPT
jgi:16S rRNA (guanine966-N2)-methyltransferase